MVLDNNWFLEQENKIPKGEVRTRFAPSPTGYMHVGGLRTALYAFLIAKNAGGKFLLRIEDTDSARFVDGATEIIIKTLRDAGIIYDEGPDIGGPVGPYVQSLRKPIYRPYAELLCDNGSAYFCFCSHTHHDDRNHADLGLVSALPDPCRDLPLDEARFRAQSGDNHVIRLKTPRSGSTSFDDLIFGRITVENKTLDDMILLKSDGLPTYNFANIIDDHLMGITHVLRGDEYLASTPKYNLVYSALGWDIPNYITVSQIMRDSRHKFSKRRGDPTYDDLLLQGFLPDAILNYVALLGWSPGGDREFFSLNDLISTFSINGISKSPALFDSAKLKYFNSEYIRALSPVDFESLARPFIRKAVPNPNLSSLDIAKILQPRCELLSDIPDKIDFFDSLPDYDVSLFTHKKSKSNNQIALNVLIAATSALSDISIWSLDSIHDCFINLAASLSLKNAAVMWPIRIALSGKSVTPGGAVEICHILGFTESIRRITFALHLLSQ